MNDRHHHTPPREGWKDVIASLRKQPHEPPCLAGYPRKQAECVCWIGRAVEFIEAHVSARAADTEAHQQEIEKLRAEAEAARDLIRRDAAFQEWAQGYLDAGRWAGHDRADAIKAELLKRDADLATLRQERDDYQSALTDVGIELGDRMKWVFRPRRQWVESSGGTLRTRLAGLLRQASYVVDGLARRLETAEQERDQWQTEIDGMIEQFCCDLNAAHNEILHLQGVAPADYGRYDWPEWSAPAHSIRWAERRLGKPLSKTSQRAALTPSAATPQEPLGPKPPYEQPGEDIRRYAPESATPQEPERCVWRDISTAPKDGTYIDLWWRGQRVVNCSWWEVGQCWIRRADTVNYIDPSHWMPIPGRPLTVAAPQEEP